MEKITDLTLLEVADKIKKGELKSEDVVRACLEQIKETANINALISVVEEERAIKQAKEADRMAAEGVNKPLLGVPVVVKDNISTTDFQTTCGSKFLKGYVPQFEATCSKKLREAGAIIIGKANMDEFAMGSSGENSAYGKTLNPVNIEYVPGGSSSGSAATVAAHQCFASLGTDTGGSIRQPAAFCGVVGIKPTYGRVSRYGVVAFGSSLDQVGPITRTVKDNALMLDIICGKDALDATSMERKDGSFLKACAGSIKGMKIGVCKEFYELGLDAEIKNEIDKTIEFYKNNGAEIVDVSLPSVSKGLAAYYVLSSAEAASNLSRFDGIKYGVRAKNYNGLVDMYFKSRTEGFGMEVKRRIMMGNYCLSAGYYDAYYKKSLQVQQVIKREFGEAFKKCDAIISPVAPTVAFKFGSKASPLEMYLGDVYTVLINVVGCPSIAFPLGLNKDGMPIACQLIGDMWQEEKLYKLANYYEEQGSKK